MIVISWNCQGLGDPRAVQVLGEIIHSRHPDVVFLCETLVLADKIEEIQSRFKFEGCFE